MVIKKTSALFNSILFLFGTGFLLSCSCTNKNENYSNKEDIEYGFLTNKNLTIDELSQKNKLLTTEGILYKIDKKKSILYIKQDGRIVKFNFNKDQKTSFNSQTSIKIKVYYLKKEKDLLYATKIKVLEKD